MHCSGTPAEAGFPCTRAIATPSSCCHHTLPTPRHVLALPGRRARRGARHRALPQSTRSLVSPCAGRQSASPVIPQGVLHQNRTDRPTVRPRPGSPLLSLLARHGRTTHRPLVKTDPRPRIPHHARTHCPSPHHHSTHQPLRKSLKDSMASSGSLLFGLTREELPGRFDTPRHPQLPVGPLEVCPHRPDPHPKPVRDLLVGQPLQCQLQDLRLTPR